VTRPVPTLVSGASLPGSLKQGARDGHLDGPSGKPADMGTFRGLRISLLLEFPPVCSRVRSHHRLGEGVLAFTKITFGTAPTTAQGAQIGRVNDTPSSTSGVQCTLPRAVETARKELSHVRHLNSSRVGPLDDLDCGKCPITRAANIPVEGATYRREGDPLRHFGGYGTAQRFAGYWDA